MTDPLVCSLCDADFTPETEGGIQFELGILPMALCPFCLNGILEMADELRPRHCPECDTELVTSPVQGDLHDGHPTPQ